MYLIQLLLPVNDNEKRPFSRREFDQVRAALTEKFGAVTAFLRSPAVGVWKENDDDVSRDDVVMFDVMVEELDEGWGQKIEKLWNERFDRRKC